MKRILDFTLPIIGKAGLIKYVFLGILSGLCSFLFIKLVTNIISIIIAGNFVPAQEYVVTFVALILAIVWLRRVVSLAIIRLSQTLFWHLRKQILLLVLNTNYQQLSTSRSDVHAAIVSDVNTLTVASMNIINFFTSAVMAVACLVYLATISWVLFLITLGAAAVGMAIYHVRSSANTRHFQLARSLENRFQRDLNAILDGFKEIYMEPKKGRHIFNTRINRISEEAYSNNVNAYTGFLNNQIIGQVLFYALIGAILIFFSVSLQIKTSDVVSFVFTLLYLLGAIDTIMVLLPGLVRAQVASTRLFDLKTKLEETVQLPAKKERTLFGSGFEQVTVTGLKYAYTGQSGEFGIGPIDLEIQKGDVAFIYGGNGTGKTTFVHSVIGLRIPTAGEIWFNNTLIDSDNYEEYRSLFSVVFSDFYLFNEVIGVEQINMDKWRRYIRLFELDEKVQLENGVFSTTDLSTGQRKRLALIGALLEEKPILVLDEWAADQDPHFRKKFYTEIIPALKGEGITIIAITHDDKYYHCADKLYKMDYGKLISESANVYQ